MGVYFVLTPGDYDDSLEWPFSKEVTFVFVDQQDSGFQVNNLVKTLTPDATEAYNRPGFGNTRGRVYVQFMRHSTLRTRQYVKNDIVYIAVAIEHWLYILKIFHIDFQRGKDTYEWLQISPFYATPFDYVID